MDYLSTDIETTDLKRHPSNVLTLGMVKANTQDFDSPLDQLPSLHVLFLHDPHSVSDYALHLNSKIFLDRHKAKEAIRKGRDPMEVEYSQKYDIIAEGWDDALQPILEWVGDQIPGLLPDGRIIGAGKNFGSFDLQFFPDDFKKHFHHRSLDPGSMFTAADDAVIPDSAECCRRAGVSDHIDHTAVRDCLTIVEVIRAYFKAVAFGLELVKQRKKTTQDILGDLDLLPAGQYDLSNEDTDGDLILEEEVKCASPDQLRDLMNQVWRYGVPKEGQKLTQGQVEVANMFFEITGEPFVKGSDT